MTKQFTDSNATISSEGLSPPLGKFSSFGAGMGTKVRQKCRTFCIGLAIIFLDSLISAFGDLLYRGTKCGAGQEVEYREYKKIVGEEGCVHGLLFLL